MIRMMGYTKWIAVLLCLLGMTACRQDAPRFRIGVAQCSDDSWRHKMNDEILREAMFYDGVSVEIRSAADDNRKQAEDVHYFIDEGVDLLIISANEAAPMTPIVEEAYQKGIPVILVDRKILSDKYTAYIGADNYEIGRAVGNYIASSLKGKGNVVELTGLGGSTPAMERHQGFMAAISNFPDIKLIDKADAAWEREPAEVEMDSMLRRHPKIDAVYAHNDRIAPGAYQAAKKVGREKEMIFVGIDALPGKGNGLEMVLDSVLNATFIYPTNGDKVMQLAMNILEKKPYPRETVMNTAVVDRTNAHVMQLQTTHISELDQKIETLNGRIGGYLSRVATQQVVMYGGLVILLLVAGLLLVVYKSLRAKNRLNKELSEQKKQLEEQRDKLEEQRDQLEEQRDKLEEQRDQLIQLSHQLEEATHAKLVFFTNISHDFRTPLTLIQGALEKMYRMDDIPQALLHPLKVMDKSTQRMLRLINQLLEFRKMQNNKLALSLQETDVVAFLYEIYLSFSDVAEQKNMDFRFLPSVPSYKMFIDKGNLDKVTYNLLSNAFKYTPSNGTIILSVNVDEGKQTLQIQVSDTGVGIPKEKQNELFKRFMQSNFSGDSIGVGLHLSHELVQVHKGTIEYKDNEGGGSVFTVCIPTDKTVYSEKDFLVPGNVLLKEADGHAHHLLQLSEELPDPEKMAAPLNKRKVLIIEDDNDIREFLREEIGAYFEVEVAADGTSGFEKARTYDADLIICDVLMPGMTGFEVTKKLKTDFDTSHIPIILLTALNSPEKHLEGIKAGADAYIAKPFSVKLLLARVFRLIEQRDKLREKFSNEPGIVRPAMCTTDRDKEFADRLAAILEQNLARPEFSIDEFAQLMKLGRTVFYRKL